MRLLSAKIQNFRMHAGEEPLEILFHPRLHVVHGPNESGKTTVMDAIAACLFEKCTLTGRAWEAMQPDDGSKPIVEVGFENDGIEYQLRKHFKGQSGTCELTAMRDGRVEFNRKGTEAEISLNEALRLPEPGKGERKEDQMAHWRLLWIDQGRSVEMPTDLINPETRDDLQSLLLTETGGTLVTADETRWIAALEESVAELFTATGKVKAGSALAQLADRKSRTESALGELQRRADEVEHESDRYLQNLRKITEIEGQIPVFREQLTAWKERQRLAENLQQETREAETRLEYTRVEADSLVKTASQLEGLVSAVKDRTEKIEAAIESLHSLDERIREDESRRAACEAERDEAETAYRAALRASMRSQINSKILRERKNVSHHETRLKQAEKLATEVDELSARVAAIQLDEADVDSLQELATKLAEAEARLQAASVRVELNATDKIRLEQGEVTEELAAGDLHERQIDRQTQITVGDGKARIRITPGGEDLAGRRESVLSATSLLQERLLQFDVNSPAQAKSQWREKQQWEADLKTAKMRLEDFAEGGVSNLRSLLYEARESLNASVALLERRTEEGDPDLPTEIEDADADEQNNLALKENAEDVRERAGQQLQALELSITGSKSDRRHLAQDIVTLRELNDADQSRIQKLIIDYGDESHIRAKRSELENEIQRLEKLQRSMQHQLDDLQPELIASETGRFERAIESADEEKRQVENEQHRILGVLSAGEAVGLNEKIGDLEAQLSSIEEECERQERHANAMRLLLETVRHCREDLTREVMEPLRRKVEPLLRVIFGGAQLDFRLDDAGSKLTLKPLVRDRVQDAFERLSAGTREQVGVAVRLALAQVLAEQFGGTLSVVLDDPFVNTDPTRLARARAMLNLVSKDLQVILLTCDFRDFRELGLEQDQITELGSTARRSC